LSYRNFLITDFNLKKLTETKRIGEYLNFFKSKYIEATESAASNDTPPAYSGPYQTAVGGKQSFVLIIPKEEANTDYLPDAIRQFNQQNYGTKNLLFSSAMLDDFRVMVKVEGLTDIPSGLVYLRAIANDLKVYGPIQNVNYRHFIITPENEAIFKKSKNILTYMEFYKQFYLK
jgi:hypothetical protein